MIQPDAIVLFSGGLDSILTALLLKEQGLEVTCLNMISPFFGHSGKVKVWKRLYNLDVVAHDVSESFVAMMRARPAHGFGKTLNPCVDCKILLLKEAKRYMLECGAKFLASGAVVGQRPMSQRRDVLNTIVHEAEVEDCLVRPLSALQLPETEVEKKGLVKRSLLLGISGRGRKEQLSLAKDRFHLREIPSPAGGCMLTERENGRRLWMVLTRTPAPTVHDFQLANVGRQLWKNEGDDWYWLSIGRNQEDNRRLRNLLTREDCLLSFPHVPAPVALARRGCTWPAALLFQAGQLTLSYACKALQSVNASEMLITRKGESKEILIEARRHEDWGVPSWEELKTEIKAERALST